MHVEYTPIVSEQLVLLTAFIPLCVNLLLYPYEKIANNYFGYLYFIQYEVNLL